MSDFVQEHRIELLNIYGMVSAGRSLELLLDNNLHPNTLEYECCAQTILIHKYANKTVDFPLPDPTLIDETLEPLVNDLHCLVLCEDAVCKGILVRDGYRYCPINLATLIEPTKYGKFLTAQ